MARSTGDVPSNAKVSEEMGKAMPAESWVAYNHAIGWRTLLNGFRRVGVLCLSANPDSVLMWSHYSKISGLALGFDRDCSELADSSYAQLEGPLPVEYSDVRPGFDAKEMKDRLREMWLAKSKHWCYESEYRCFRPVAEGQTRSTIRFAPDSLQEIIVGIGMDTVTASLVWSVQKEKYPHANLLIAVPKPGEYEIGLYQAPANRKIYSDFFNTENIGSNVIPDAIDEL